jgi:CheY-like chemotaxis protein
VSVERVLLVDDELDNRVMMSYFLESWGYGVELAEDGEKALEAVAQRRPDLVLLDLQMPIVDGFETCRRLKEDPETESIPVVLLTSCDSIEAKVEGLRCGADDYVVRSTDSAELRARLDAVLRRSRRYSPPAFSSATADGSSETEGKPVLTGSLEEKSFPEAFQLAQAYGQTGMLIVEDPPQVARIYLDEGEVVSVVVDEVPDLSGEEAFYEIALWSRGSFRYLVGTTAPERNITTPATNLLLEATRRLDEWTFLRAKIPHFDAVPHRVAVSGGDRLRLTRADWSVVRRADGRKSIRQLAAELEQDPFETGRTVFGLLTVGAFSLDPQRREEETLFGAVPEIVETPSIPEPYELSEEEWRIVSLIDGERDLSSIVTLSGLAPAKLARFFQSLSQRGLVHVRAHESSQEFEPEREQEKQEEEQEREPVETAPRVDAASGVFAGRVGRSG